MIPIYDTASMANLHYTGNLPTPHPAGWVKVHGDRAYYSGIIDVQRLALRDLHDRLRSNNNA